MAAVQSTFVIMTGDIGDVEQSTATGIGKHGARAKGIYNGIFDLLATGRYVTMLNS